MPDAFGKYKDKKIKSKIERKKEAEERKVRDELRKDYYPIRDKEQLEKEGDFNRKQEYPTEKEENFARYQMNGRDYYTKFNASKLNDFYLRYGYKICQCEVCYSIMNYQYYQQIRNQTDHFWRN